MKHSVSVVLALVAALTVGSGHAEDIKWNGFVNVIGGVLKDEPVSDNSKSQQVPGYPGYDDNFSIDQKTSAGLQARKSINKETSITAQLLVDRTTDDYEANFRWFYVTYTPTSHSSFRVGRLGSPVYYFSDFLNIGYAYHWVTPPREVYAFDTIIDGVDYIYQDVWRDYDWSAEFFAGQADQKLKDPDAHLKTRNTVGGVLTASTDGWLTFRAMYFMTHASLDVDALSDEALAAVVSDNVDEALASTGYTPFVIATIKPILQQQAETKLADGQLDLQDFITRYGELAIRAETERWLVMTEVVSLNTDKYVYNNTDAWIVTGGVHSGRALYYLSYSDSKTKMHEQALEDLAYTLPDNVDLSVASDYLANRIRGAIAAVSSRRQNTTSLGVRIDTTQHTALKFELSYFEEKRSHSIEKAGIGDNLLFRTAFNVTF